MCSGSFERMGNIQVRDLPDDVHRRLKAQAGLAGQSLNEYLRERLTEVARQTTPAEMLARIASREPYAGPSTATIIREARDR